MALGSLETVIVGEFSKQKAENAIPALYIRIRSYAFIAQALAPCLSAGYCTIIGSVPNVLFMAFYVSFLFPTTLYQAFETNAT